MTAIGLEVSPDDPLDERFMSRVAGDDGVDQMPVAQDRGAVGDLPHLVHVMGDEDDARALFCAAPDQSEKLLHSRARQERCRLVEHQNAGPVGVVLRRVPDVLVGPHDREKRLLDRGERADLCPRIEREAEAGERVVRLRVDRPPVQRPIGAGREPSHVEVLCDRK